MWKSARPVASATLWSPRMIEKTRIRFICIAMLALAVSMILVVSAINCANWLDIRHELDETLNFLVRFSGPPPQESADRWAGNSRHRWNILSESRYFAAVRRSDHMELLINHMIGDTYTDEDLLGIAAQAEKKARASGRIGDFLYRSITGDGTAVTYVFLNIETRLQRQKRLIAFSLASCLIGILISFIIVVLYSRRVVRPIEENIARMKRFITDASHELKTPLTVISANMDVVALDQPDNTWVRSTQKQTATLRRMVDEMVYLTRIEEADAPLSMQRVELGPLLSDAADPYAAMAEFGGRALTLDIGQDVFVNGDKSALTRLMTILMDNALKYASKGASISVRCVQEGRHALIETLNPVDQPLSREQCLRLFDRFYRVDESRTKAEHSGFGIGLAIASAIAERHGGKMSARMAGDKLEIQCRLPLA